MPNLFRQPEETQYLRTISARLGGASVRCLRRAEISMATLVAVPANAVRAPEPAPKRANRSANKIAAGASAGSAGIPHSSQADRRSGKIFFLAMTLARSTKPLVGCSGSFRAQPVSPALRAPLLFAAFGLPIVMSCLPLSPPPCSLPALLAAVARQWVNAGGIAARILSANKPDCADVGVVSFVRLFCDGQLDFLRQLNDLH